MFRFIALIVCFFAIVWFMLGVWSNNDVAMILKGGFSAVCLAILGKSVLDTLIHEKNDKR